MSREDKRRQSCHDEKRLVDYARWHATEDRGNRFCPPVLFAVIVNPAMPAPQAWFLREQVSLLPLSPTGIALLKKSAKFRSRFSRSWTIGNNHCAIRHRLRIPSAHGGFLCTRCDSNNKAGGQNRLPRSSVACHLA